ncbi:hypothetical protein [Terrabacter sp. BE26]|uniref:hypothetical protein n=1 Tax=Terrabacter sp. BE26 TaxID=2898152 RepID=UPI0035BE7567
MHDDYVWKVNAAVGEGRDDLVRQFTDQYMDEALRLIASTESPTCGRANCRVCAPEYTTEPQVTHVRRRWLHPA